jgi:hypothetical protein
MVATENIPHRDRIDAVPEVCQRALDAPIAPGSVLLRHLDHELFDLLNDTGSSKLLSMFAPGELLRDQSFVPPQEGVGGHEGRDFFEALAPERVGACGEAAAFRVGQAQPATTELGFEDTIRLRS